MNELTGPTHPVMSTPMIGGGESVNQIELARAEQEAIQEIQATMTVAKRFPRNDNNIYQKLMAACQRPGFAADVEYAFPRGGKTVRGLSIYFAREAGRLFGNIRHGAKIIQEDRERRTIEAYAWDVETNTYVSAQDSFMKLVQRKDRDGVTKWVQPDERDLRELTNNRAAKLKRNCILELIPQDWKDEAAQQARATVEKKITDDPAAAKKAILIAFDKLGVRGSDIEQLIKVPLEQANTKQLSDLRETYRAIRDGETTLADLLGTKVENAPKDEVKEKLRQKARQAEAPKQEAKKDEKPKDEEPAEPAKAEEAEKPAVKTGKLFEGDSTQEITQEQVARLSELCNSSPALARLCETRLKKWGMDSIHSVNAGTAQELIELLESQG